MRKPKFGSSISNSRSLPNAALFRPARPRQVRPILAKNMESSGRSDGFPISTAVHRGVNTALHRAHLIRDGLTYMGHLSCWTS